MTTYCVDCEHFKKHPVMAETSMDSGVYVENGFYHRCELSWKIFPTGHYTEEEIGFLYCNDKKGK